MQIMEVTAVNGNTVTFATPFHITFKTAYAAQLTRYKEPVLRGAGVEDIYFYGGGGGKGNVNMSRCAYCWFKHIESDWGVGAVHFAGSTVPSCGLMILHGTPDANPGGGGYLFALTEGSADNLIENNIMWYATRSSSCNVPVAETSLPITTWTTRLARPIRKHQRRVLMPGTSRPCTWNCWRATTASITKVTTTGAIRSTSRCSAIICRPFAPLTSAQTYTSPPYPDMTFKGVLRWMFRPIATTNFVGNVLGMQGQKLLSYSGSGHSSAQTSWAYREFVISCARRCGAHVEHGRMAGRQSNMAMGRYDHQHATA